MRMLSILLLASFFSWNSLSRFLKETNSDASARRGVSQFQKGRFGDAEKSFQTSRALRPDAVSTFNLGTSQIAAGHFEEGSQTLSPLTQNPQLRADAFYNRGNSALGSKAYDYAIRDYAEALKLRPNDAAAKRNLEIALKRKAESTPSPSSKPQQQQQQQQQQQKSPQQGGNQNPDNGSQKEQRKGDADVDALLRSVQQQEKEELARMKRSRNEGKRVGW